MSVVLTHGYFIQSDAKEQKIMKPYPPLGLLCLSAFLKEHDVAHSVYDTTFQSERLQETYLIDQQAQIIAIYVNLMTKVKVIELIKKLKTDSQYGYPKIILGGPDITYNCDNYLNAGADYLVIGEGEETLLELVKAIQNKETVHEIKGIAFMTPSGLQKNSPRTKIKDISALPFPNRNAIDMQPYLKTWKAYHGSNSMTVSTQRGCPYTCKWCSTAVYGQSYRRRAAKKVVAELIDIKRNYNPDAIWFVDDVFTVSHKWIAAFHEEMKQQQFSIPFECITRAERLNEEVLQLLKEAGCFRIWIGAESGSQKIIDKMDRRVDVGVVQEAIQMTNAIGIETGTFIMVGYPGEDENDIRQTIQHLNKANPSHFTITVTYPIKGTSLYNEIEDKITTNHNWEISTDREIDFKRKYPRRFYDFAVQYIINEVHYLKALRHQKKSFVSILKLKLKSIAALAGMKFLKQFYLVKK